MVFLDIPQNIMTILFNALRDVGTKAQQAVAVTTKIIHLVKEIVSDYALNGSNNNGNLCKTKKTEIFIFL